MNTRIARQTILVGVASFLAGQAILNAAVRNQILPLADPIYIEKFERLQQHREFFAEQSPQTRYLLLGSSRSQLGFDAGRFSARVTPPAIAFNFGTHGAGPLTNALYFDRLWQAGVRPDHVLIEVHPCLLHEQPLEAVWLSGYRLLPGEPEQLRAFGLACDGPAHLGATGWVSAAFAYRLPALNRYAEHWLPCPFGLTIGPKLNRFGFAAGLDLPAAERPAAFQRTIVPYLTALKNYRVGGVPLVALRSLIATCQAKHVQVSLLISSEDSAFRSLYPAQSHVDLLAELVTLRVPIVDARMWVPDDGFADGHHMTPGGSAAFTDRLADVLSATGGGAP